VLEPAAVDGDVGVADPMAAEAVGVGLLPPLFEVHAVSRTSATHRALAAVATARRWR
jgi:hypothetical protein